MNPSEPAIVRARALYAVAHPDSGATPGERENALSLLARHLEKNGLTMADLDGAAGTVCSLFAVANVKKPKPCAVMAMLATQLARYISGKDDILCKARKVKLERGGHCYLVEALLTAAEERDWREAMDHYAPLLESCLVALRRAESAARRARRKALSGFVNRFALFPPDAKTRARKMTSQEHAALMAAMSAAKGEQWIRKAGYLGSQMPALGDGKGAA